MNALSQKNNKAEKPFAQLAKVKHLIQPKLSVNTPGDIYEQEADAMADRVMRMSSNVAAKPVTGLIGNSLQRTTLSCEEGEGTNRPLMRKASAGSNEMAVSSSFASSLDASKGGGSPLPQGTRNFMESAFSADFSGVRIHADSQASEMSNGINAKAFTHGSDIYFNSGEFQPNSANGKHLLAHELAHVEQQSGKSSLDSSGNTGLIQRQPLTKAAEAAQIIGSIISPGSLSVTADEMEGWHYAPNVTPPAAANRQIIRNRVRFYFLLESLLTFDIYRVTVRMDYETDGAGVGNISFIVEDKMIDALYNGDLHINLTRSDISSGIWSHVRLSLEYSLSGNLFTLYGNESGNYSYLIYSDGDIIGNGYNSDDMTERMVVDY